MKVTIQASIDSERDDIDIVLTNEGLSSLNFVELITHKENYTISIDDLATAINTFIVERKAVFERDKLLE